MEPWQTTLGDILTGYFADYDFEEGVEEMAGVTADSDDYHHRYLTALDEGISAAGRRDDQVVRLIIDSFAQYVGNTDDARDYLESIRAAYLQRRQAAR